MADEPSGKTTTATKEKDARNDNKSSGGLVLDGGVLEQHSGPDKSSGTIKMKTATKEEDAGNKVKPSDASTFNGRVVGYFSGVNNSSGTATISGSTLIIKYSDGKEAKYGTCSIITGSGAIDHGGLIKSGADKLTVKIIGQLPATLDQALTKAMETNPTIMAAKARTVLAEAELSNAQMDVTRRIVQLWSEHQLQQLKYDSLIEAMKKSQGSVTAQDIIKAGAAVSQIEMELRCLIGQASASASRSSPSNPTAPFERPAKPLQLPRGPAVEKVRKALLSPTEITFVKAPLQEVMEYLKDKHKIEIQVDGKALAEAGIGTDMPITFDLKPPSLAAALQALDDLIPQLKLVVRDYGLLVTTPERARQQGYFPAIDFARLGLGGEAAAAADPFMEDPKQPAHREQAAPRKSSIEPSPFDPSPKPPRKPEKKAGSDNDPFQ